MSLTANAILTLDEAKRHLQAGALAATDDPIIETAVEGISSRFASVIGTMSLAKTTYTAQTLDGSGIQYLYLPAWPVVTITSITEDGTALTDGTHYYLDSKWGILEHMYGDWIDKRKAIIITYDAGYVITGTVTLPWDLKLAALDEVARKVQNIKYKLFGEESRSSEAGTSSFNLDEFLPETLATLNRYKRYRV